MIPRHTFALALASVALLTIAAGGAAAAPPSAAGTGAGVAPALQTTNATPGVSDAFVTVNTSDGVYAKRFDPLLNETVWEVKLSGANTGREWSRTAVSEDYVAFNPGNVTVFHTNGTEAWNVSDGNDVAIGGGKLWVAFRQQGELTSYHVENGSLINTYVYDPADPDDSEVGPPMAVDASEDGSAYVYVRGDSTFNTDDRLNKVRDGTTHWTTEFTTRTGGHSMVRLGPDETAVYVAANSLGLRRLDPADGTIEWSNASSMRSLATDKEDGARQLYSGSARRQPATGDLIWNSSSAGHIDSAYSGDLVLGADGSTLTVIESSDGTLHQSQAMSGDVVSVRWTPDLGGELTIQLTRGSGEKFREANVTVRLWGVNTNELNATADRLNQTAADVLDNVSDIYPDGFDPDSTSLTDTFSSASSDYVAVNTRSEWTMSPVVEQLNVRSASSVDLDRTDPTFPSDQEVVLSVWDPSDQQGIIGSADLVNPIDNELPGSSDSGTIVVEQLYGNESIDSQSVETEPTATSYQLSLDVRKTHEAVSMRLPDGVYRASPKDSSVQTVFVVGEPAALEHFTSSKAQTAAGELAERSSEIQSLIQDGKIAPKRAATDSNGTATISVHSAITHSTITAYKGPQGLYDALNVSAPADLNVTDLGSIRELGYNGSFVAGGRSVNARDRHGQTVEVPAATTSMTPLGDIERFQQLQAWLQNLSLTDLNQLPPEWEQSLDELNESQLRRLYESLYDTATGLPFVEERYEEKYGQSIPAPDSLESSSALRREIVRVATLLDSLSKLPGEISSDVDISDGMLDMPIATGCSEIDENATGIRLHWSDGSAPEPMSDEYWSVTETSSLTSIDIGPLSTGGETIEIEDYPFRDRAEGRALADVTPNIVCTSGDGDPTLRRPRIPIENPEFDGDIPNIDAWDVSNTHPGPDERVRVTLRSTDEAFGGVQNLTAYDADGGDLNVTVHDDGRYFTTSGSGAHTVRVEYTDTTGATFVDQIRIKAREEDVAQSPTLRWTRGVGHDVAVAGSDLRSGRIDAGDSEVGVGIVQQDPESPVGQVHVHAESEVSGVRDVELRMMHPDESSVRGNVPIALHTTIGANVLLWRDENAIDHQGETPYGEVRHVEGGQGDRPKRVIRTYTEGDGSVTLYTIADAGLVEETLHWLAVSGLPSWRPDGDLLGFGVLVVAIGSGARRRRRGPGTSAPTDATAEA